MESDMEETEHPENFMVMYTNAAERRAKIYVAAEARQRSGISIEAYEGRNTTLMARNVSLENLVRALLPVLDDKYGYAIIVRTSGTAPGVWCLDRRAKQVVSRIE